MYALETRDEQGGDLAVSLVGLPADSDWVLNGPYSDKTLMRNYLAYKWANDMGDYAPRTRFVEVYLNSGSGAVNAADYVGVYVLVEKIKQGEDRVDVEDLDPSDIAEPEVTGGYIFKKDRLDPGDSGFTTNSGQVLAYVYPKEDEISPEQAAYLQRLHQRVRGRALWFQLRRSGQRLCQVHRRASRSSTRTSWSNWPRTSTDTA